MTTTPFPQEFLKCKRYLDAAQYLTKYPDVVDLMNMCFAEGCSEIIQDGGCSPEAEQYLTDFVDSHTRPGDGAVEKTKTVADFYYNALMKKVNNGETFFSMISVFNICATLYSVLDGDEADERCNSCIEMITLIRSLTAGQPSPAPAPAPQQAPKQSQPPPQPPKAQAPPVYTPPPPPTYAPPQGPPQGPSQPPTYVPPQGPPSFGIPQNGPPVFTPATQTGENVSYSSDDFEEEEVDENQNQQQLPQQPPNTQYSQPYGYPQNAPPNYSQNLPPNYSQNLPPNYSQNLPPNCSQNLPQNKFNAEAAKQFLGTLGYPVLDASRFPPLSGAALIQIINSLDSAIYGIRNNDNATSLQFLQNAYRMWTAGNP